jgi:FMN-dependent NADH-azoreductase
MRNLSVVSQTQTGQPDPDRAVRTGKSGNEAEKLKDCEEGHMGDHITHRHMCQEHIAHLDHKYIKGNSLKKGKGERTSDHDTSGRR